MHIIIHIPSVCMLVITTKLTCYWSLADSWWGSWHMHCYLVRCSTSSSAAGVLFFLAFILLGPLLFWSRPLWITSITLLTGLLSSLGAGPTPSVLWAGPIPPSPGSSSWIRSYNLNLHAPHLTSPHLTSPHLTSPTSPHLTLPCTIE